VRLVTPPPAPQQAQPELHMREDTPRKPAAAPFQRPKPQTVRALVLLFLDESGNAIAARIEASSGHALLDAAAVRAARTLRAMPASTPREAVLPVRFRLR